MTKAQLIGANEIDQAMRNRYEPTLDDARRWESLGLGTYAFRDGKPTFHPSMELMTYFADGNQAT